MYKHLQPTVRDFDLDLFIIHVGTNDIPLNNTKNGIAEDIVKLEESIETNSVNVVISNIDKTKVEV